MKQSKYLEAFKRAAEEVKESYQLNGGFVLVERIPQEEIQRKSGLIIPINDKQVNSLGANLPVFVHVLAVGEGYYKEDGTTQPTDVQPGDIILVGANSVKWFPVFEVDNYQPFEIGLTDEQETQIKFKGPENYQRFVESLNRRT